MQPVPQAQVPAAVSRTANDLRKGPVLRWMLFYAQFLVRVAFAGLIFLYAQSRGIAPGLLSSGQVVALIEAYVAAIALLMLVAGGKKLDLGLQRCLIAADMTALALGMPQDPNPGLPMLFVFYAVFIDYGLRSLRQYVEGLCAGLVALAVMVSLRARYIETGFSTADGWTVLVFVAVAGYLLATFMARDRMAQSLRRLREQLTVAAQATGLGTWSANLRGGQIEFDDNACHILGLPPGVTQCPFSELPKLVLQDDRQRAAEAVRDAIRTRRHLEVEYRVRWPDGSVHPVMMRGIVECNAAGRPFRMVGVCWDFTERDQERERLARLEEWRLLAARAGDVAVWTWFVDKDHFEHDGNGERLFGLQPGSLADKHKIADFFDMIYPDDRPQVQQAVQRGLSERAEYFVEFRVTADDGEIHWMQSRGTAQYDEQGNPWKASGATWNADRLVALRQALEARTRELEQTNRELDALSQRDGLTGVKNRRSFDECLAQEWARCTRGGYTLALLMLDIDHFKLYNDSLGHLAGDACLRAIAQALQANLLRASDFLARYGGEEFAIVLPETTLAGAAEVAERLLCAIRALGLPHPASRTAPVVTACIGCAVVVPAKDVAATTLVAAADAALYRAKNAGRNRSVCAENPGT